MRAGGCTVQQALTNEAATVVKQAVSLARRRGHAQVTPLHVANTMLSTSTGLLRTACIQSHSHPLQCRALELCFNVALNRLPASSNSSPLLGPHSQYPSISNALLAAFKRAQAHQRRGSIENQQQPLLAVKIELEQLIISILDDPSVSRVMREAGFSSTQVKSNVEQAVSLEICSQNAPSSANSKLSKESSKGNLVVLSRSPPATVAQDVGSTKLGKARGSDIPVGEEDVMFVIENLMNKKRRSNVVVVGECMSTIEDVVRAVIEKVDKGEDVKFMNLSLSSLGHLNRGEVEQKVEEVKRHVRKYSSTLGAAAGIVLNLGDLKWVVEYRASSSSSSSSSEQQLGSSSRIRGYYCPVEHMVMELGKLVCSINGDEMMSGRFRLMGMATFQTYMRCKSGHPSLETLWGLHPLTIPAGSLRLSLITDSEQRQSTSKKVEKGSSWILVDDEEKQPSCCGDCSAKFENEVRSLQSSACNNGSTISSLPPWFQPYKLQDIESNDKDSASISVRELCKKWSSFCNSVHKQPYSSERGHTFFSSASPSSSTSCFSHDHHHHHQWPDHQSWRDHNFWISEAAAAADHNGMTTTTTGLRLYYMNNIPQHKDPKQLLLSTSNPNSSPNSASSTDHAAVEYVHKFKELNAENLTTLCTALEEKVPWQKDIIPEIVSTILKCRSGMLRRKGNWLGEWCKEETWLLFQGVDVEAKEKIAGELARLVFGSQTNMVTIALSSFSCRRADEWSEDSRNKRSRDEQRCSYMERFAEAVWSNPHRVFFIEDVEQADYCSQMGFKRAIERGRISKINADGEEASLSDAIIILSCESFCSSRSRACSPPTQEHSNVGASEDQEISLGVSLDLNISIDDDDITTTTVDQDQSIHDIGLLQSVDRRVIFKMQQQQQL